MSLTTAYVRSKNACSSIATSLETMFPGGAITLATADLQNMLAQGVPLSWITQWLNRDAQVALAQEWAARCLQSVTAGWKTQVVDAVNSVAAADAEAVVGTLDRLRREASGQERAEAYCGFAFCRFVIAVAPGSKTESEILELASACIALAQAMGTEAAETLQQAEDMAAQINLGRLV